jgi:hypothetical protein
VIWNALVGELWRRTIIYLRRMMARLTGVAPAAFDRLVRLSYAKVVEYQKRGSVHVHAVIRLDGRDGGDPPGCVSSGSLVAALQLAASRVSVPRPGGGGPLRWGDQLDTKPVVGDLGGALSTEAVANYIAKYSTKSVEAVGVLDRRLKSQADIDGRPIPAHLRRLAGTAWRLGGEPEFKDLRLRLWAHDLGHRGHWLTKSRSWSTTFKALRTQRHQWKLEQLRERAPTALRWRPSTRLEVDWRLRGVGWASQGDQLLADTLRRHRAEARLLAREDERDALLRGAPGPTRAGTGPDDRPARPG